MTQKWNLRQNAVYKIVWYLLHWPLKIFIQDKRRSCSGPCITAVSPAALMMGCAFPLDDQLHVCSVVLNSCARSLRAKTSQLHDSTKWRKLWSHQSKVSVIKASKLPQEKCWAVHVEERVARAAAVLVIPFPWTGCALKLPVCTA